MCNHEFPAGADEQADDNYDNPEQLDPLGPPEAAMPDAANDLLGGGDDSGGSAMSGLDESDLSDAGSEAALLDLLLPLVYDLLDGRIPGIADVIVAEPAYDNALKAACAQALQLQGDDLDDEDLEVLAIQVVNDMIELVFTTGAMQANPGALDPVEPVDGQAADADDSDSDDDSGDGTAQRYINNKDQPLWTVYVADEEGQLHARGKGRSCCLGSGRGCLRMSSGCRCPGVTIHVRLLSRLCFDPAVCICMYRHSSHTAPPQAPPTTLHCGCPCCADCLCACHARLQRLL